MKRTAVAAGLAALLGLGAFVLRPVHRKAAATATVLAQQPSEVRRLQIESGGRQVDVERTGDGTWRAAPGTSPQSATLLFGLEQKILPMLAYRTVTADPSDPQFGLQKPDVVLEVEDMSGVRQRVELGAASFTGGGFYARLTGTGGRPDDPRRLYLVARQTMDELRSLAVGQPVHSPNPSGDRISRVDAEQGNQDQPAVTPYLQQVLDTGATAPEGHQ
jgi:hypothetical protein